MGDQSSIKQCRPPGFCTLRPTPRNTESPMEKHSAKLVRLSKKPTRPRRPSRRLKRARRRRHLPRRTTPRTTPPTLRSKLHPVLSTSFDQAASDLIGEGPPTTKLHCHGVVNPNYGAHGLGALKC